MQSLDGLAELAVIALGSAEQYEEQRQNLLDSIHRLTQLYDLEKSLNETLDFEPLLELIPVKVAAMLPCQAIHLWMFDGGRLRLVSAWGADATAEVGATEGAGEGYVGDMAEEGVPLLINDYEDPRLATRNERAGEGSPITNALLVPLIEHEQNGGGESELGVLEAVNKAGGAPFSEDDLFFMNSMSETVSSALKNASLMYAERKLEILQALVQVSSEITSTLRLDRLLQIIVNSPQSVLPFERCSIALDNRGRLQLKAVSGMENIPVGEFQVERLRELLLWLSSYDRPLLVRQHGEEPETEDPRTRATLAKHFEASGYRALFALPLSDDQGRVGLLLYESSDPDFLEQAHIEMIKVLAGQTTVAIRNALLYREVPLINLLEPLVQRKQAFLRSERKRQGIILGSIAAAILLLIFCPLPLRISGTAVVAPQSVVTLAAPVEGTIANVYAREGQHVRRGEVLGTMDDWSWRNQLTAAQAKYEAAMLAMQGDLARHSAQAGEERTQADFLRAEMERTRLRIANAQLRSPIDGVVMTPDLQNAVGEHLDAGATFARVLNLASARINIAVDQQDAHLVQSGQTAAVKLDSFPAQTPARPGIQRQPRSPAQRGRPRLLRPCAAAEWERGITHRHGWTCEDLRRPPSGGVCFTARSGIMAVGKDMGLDRLVTIMPRIHWIAFATICCLAGCNQDPPASAPSPALASSPAAPDADPPVPPASIATGGQRNFTTTGPLVVEQQADVVAERDGRVTTVEAEIGDHVHRGDVLAPAGRSCAPGGARGEGGQDRFPTRPGANLASGTKE